MIGGLLCFQEGSIGDGKYVAWSILPGVILPGVVVPVALLPGWYRRTKLELTAHIGKHSMAATMRGAAFHELLPPVHPLEVAVTAATIAVVLAGLGIWLSREVPLHDILP